MEVMKLKRGGKKPRECNVIKSKDEVLLAVAAQP